MNRHFARLASIASVAILAAGLAPLGVMVVSAAPAPPFNQCPAVGQSPSCGSLLVINADRSVSVITDPGVGPFDGIEDTLIGIQNDSSVTVGAITAFGPPGVFGFDGDGNCAGYSPSPVGCPFGPTTYEGPGVTFVLDPTNTADGEIDFAGAGIAPGGSAYFSLEGAITSATLKAIVGRLSFCNQAGQVPTQASVAADGWSLTYGISVCEGLVLSHVALGQRLMAERMSVPYLDLVTCTSTTTINNCTNTTTRHITLRTDEVEAQTDPSAYTRVHLLGPATATSVRAPNAGSCHGEDRKSCDYEAVVANYRVDLSPAPAVGDPATFIDITQRYEFYTPFSEKNLKDIACEPSQNSPFPVNTVVTPLPDCGRWKPLVSYQYSDTSGSTMLVSLNAAARLHFTPDALAVRASTFIRDCDKNIPTAPCDHPFSLGNIEVFPPGPIEDAIQQESVVRGLVADPTGPHTLPGRYDNVHQTPSAHVVLPIPPPGCPECVHIHWRWGANIANAFFGSGQPLIGDGEPAAVPNPLSHQQLDAAMVAYHSDQLAPANFMQLVQGANPNQLQLTSSSDYRVSGFTRGTETPEHPSGSCSFRPDMTSWGQCGQVLWLSATTYTTIAQDENKDVFFAFGGFFCETCGQQTDYSLFVSGFAATYSEGKHPSKSRTFAVGSNMKISFAPVLYDAQLNDVLPPVLTGVAATMVLVRSNGVPIQGGPTFTCPVTTDASGRKVVTCQTPSLTQGALWGITITGTVDNVAPGTYQNTVHGVWGDPGFNIDRGGNYKNTDDITITA